MELKIKLVIYTLFFSLFFLGFLSCFSLGLFLVDYNSFTLEVLLPYSFLSEMPLVFTFDYVSLIFFSAVSLISRVVFLYSKYYMDDSVLLYNSDNSRFFYLLFLFVVSMFFLVFSGSWVVVILGWDGLGLVSFLLVIYYNNRSRLDSGLITVFTNRVGDCLFILSFMFIFYCGWFRLDFLSFYRVTLFSVVLFLGCITKRAQIPFSSWLPAAMAAPTPVSSLVHSSTLVTAGVYLIVRFNYLFEGIYPFLICISLFTIFLAGLCAVYELDFKKVVAISTLSQLGFIVFSISCGYWVLSFLHIIFHAFFKRSLFLSTGRIIHYLLGDQDSRNFGSLGSSFFSKLLFFIRSLSLIGFPFSLGFYSKDTILGEILFSRFNLISFLFLFGCCFTVAYRARLIYMGFIGFPSFFSSFSFGDDKFFYLPVIILYFFCVFIGNYFFFYFIPPVVFSFMEVFFGLLVIRVGLFLFKLSPSGYLLEYSLITISFLALLRSSFLSSLVKKFSYEGEYTWSEVFGGKGGSEVMKYFNTQRIRLYTLNFSSIVLITLLFFFLVEYVESPEGH